MRYAPLRDRDSTVHDGSAMRLSGFVSLALLSCAELACGLNLAADDPLQPASQPPPSPLQCRNHTPAVGLQSTYDGHACSLSFLCLPPPDTLSSFQPTSSTYNISHRRDTTVGCVNNTLISGLTTWHRGGSGDREREEEGGEERDRLGEVAVACSSPPAGYSLGLCSWSRWLNRPRQNLSVPALPLPWVMRSVTSRLVLHDWRYKLELCQLTGFPPLYLHSNTCQVPSVPHGRIRNISHTHSITKSHSPFKIKISLTCDPTYYLNQTNSLAVCENGTWTRHPTCSACSSIAYCEEVVCTSATDSKCVRCLPTLPDGLPLVISKSGRRCRAVPVISTAQLMVGFVAGSNQTLDCITRGRPTPSLSWHRVLANEERVPLLDHTHFVPHNNGSVTIVNITNMDSGPYVCRAWNAAGSDIVYIDVYNSRPDGTGPPSIHHWSPLHVVSLSPEHTFTSSHLHCHAQGFPPPTITWSHLTITSSPSHTLTSTPPIFHPLLSPTVTQYWNGSLVFHPVRNEDTALYRCEATNLFGTITMETILFVDTSTDDGPSITNWTASYTATVGGASLEMTCNVHSAHNTHHVMWMKKGERASISGTRVWQNGNGTLVMESVLSEDGGPYWCVAWDEGGVTMETTQLNVVINDHPLIIMSGSIPFHHCLILRLLILLLIAGVLHVITL